MIEQYTRMWSTLDLRAGHSDVDSTGPKDSPLGCIQHRLEKDLVKRFWRLLKSPHYYISSHNFFSCYCVCKID